MLTEPDVLTEHNELSCSTSLLVSSPSQSCLGLNADDKAYLTSQASTDGEFIPSILS